MYSTAPLQLVVLFVSGDSTLSIKKEDGRHVKSRFGEAAALTGPEGTDGRIRSEPHQRCAGLFKMPPGCSRCHRAVQDATGRDASEIGRLGHALTAGSVVPIMEADHGLSNDVDPGKNPARSGAERGAMRGRAYAPSQAAKDFLMKATGRRLERSVSPWLRFGQPSPQRECGRGSGTTGARPRRRPRRQ